MKKHGTNGFQTFKRRTWKRKHQQTYKGTYKYAFPWAFMRKSFFNSKHFKRIKTFSNKNIFFILYRSKFFNIYFYLLLFGINIPQSMTPKSSAVNLLELPTRGTLGQFRSKNDIFCHEFMIFWPFGLCQSIFLTTCAYFWISILIKHSRKFVNCSLGMCPSIFWPSVPRVLLCIMLVPPQVYEFMTKYSRSWQPGWMLAAQNIWGCNRHEYGGLKKN